MAKRTCVVRLLPALLALAGCGAEEGGLGKPSVNTGPVDAITLRFDNQSGDDLFVDWPSNQPRFVVKRNDVALMTHRGCVPFCGDGCACAPCPTTKARVRRIPAGESLTVLWEPIHYAINACNGSSSCSCVETWPVTAGSYDLSLSGFTQAEGGEPSRDDPDLLIGASPSSASRVCIAKGLFDLPGGESVQAKFGCP